MRTSSSPLIFALLLLSFCCLTACYSDEPPPPPADAQPVEPSPAATPPPAATTGEPPLAPITSRQRSADGSTIVGQGVVFTLPASWISEPPSSSMRLAQARIPGAAGEGQLTVFYFGPGGGGGLEANIQRWVGQVEADSEASRDSFDANGFRITWVGVSGTLKPSTMGTGPSTPQPGSRLLGGIVEGGQGPWYFKATGPAETLLAEHDAFLDLLRSAEPHG